MGYCEAPTQTQLMVELKHLTRRAMNKLPLKHNEAASQRKNGNNYSVLGFVMP